MHHSESLLYEDIHSPSFWEYYLLIASSWVSPNTCRQPKGATSPRGSIHPMTGRKVGTKELSSIWDISEGPSQLQSTHQFSLGFCCNRIRVQLLPVLSLGSLNPLQRVLFPRALPNEQSACKPSSQCSFPRETNLWHVDTSFCFDPSY